MKAVSNQAWWLAAMMYGGFGMFSSPPTLIRNSSRTIHPTSRRMNR